MWQFDRGDHKTYSVLKNVPLTAALTVLLHSDLLFSAFCH